MKKKKLKKNYILIPEGWLKFKVGTDTLARKLPDEIVAVFSDINYADKLQQITERKLRPITLMTTDREKIEAFNELMSSDTNSR